MLITGPIWAKEAWSSYWNWDPKEVWAFITWVVYAAYLHARATAGWKGRNAAILALVGVATLWFNFIGINYFSSASQHSYATAPAIEVVHPSPLELCALPDHLSLTVLGVVSSSRRRDGARPPGRDWSKGSFAASASLTGRLRPEMVLIGTRPTCGSARGWGSSLSRPCRGPLLGVVVVLPKARWCRPPAGWSRVRFAASRP